MITVLIASLKLNRQGQLKVKTKGAKFLSHCKRKYALHWHVRLRFCWCEVERTLAGIKLVVIHISSLFLLNKTRQRELESIVSHRARYFSFRSKRWFNHLKHILKWSINPLNKVCNGKVVLLWLCYFWYVLALFYRAQYSTPLIVKLKGAPRHLTLPIFPPLFVSSTSLLAVDLCQTIYFISEYRTKSSPAQTHKRLVTMWFI